MSAGLATRKRLVLAKIETTYGVDSLPGGQNALAISDLNFTPLSATQVSRNLIRPFFGNSEQLLAEKFVQMDFEVELAGAGCAGVVPAYDALLQACAFSPLAETTPITGSFDGTTFTVHKLSHGLQVGDQILLGGFTDPTKNGQQQVATVVDSNNITILAPDPSMQTETNATGTAGFRVVYQPLSSGIQSITLYVNVDGVLHRVTGALGTFEISPTVKQIPTFKFTFTGIYNAPADVAAVTPNFSGFQIPFVVNTQNTPGFTLFGYTGLMQSFSLQMGNSVQYITLVGQESVQILDRAVSGTVVFQAPHISVKDFFTLASQNTKGPMSFIHGSRSGSKVEIDCGSVLIGNPTYQDSNGVQMLSAPYTAQPSSNGNDEVVISVY